MLPACVQCADSTIIIMFWLLPEVLAVTIHGGYAQPLETLQVLI